MRKLGVGRTLAFILTEEIATKVRKRTKLDDEDRIGVEEVILWSMGETFTDLRKSIGPWAVQGQRFESNQKLLKGKRLQKKTQRSFLSLMHRPWKNAIVRKCRTLTEKTVGSLGRLQSENRPHSETLRGLPDHWCLCRG